MVVWRVGRRNSIRWLIRLPQSFDGYLKSLGSATRKNDVRKFRQLDRKEFEVHVIDRDDQIETFLQDGEKVSRLTYQWNVGQRLCNDEPTRQRLVQQAKRKQFRGYIIYKEREPCAYAWGEVSYQVYHSNTPGFDPRYKKESLGTSLMLWVIRDLIENTDFKVFDFGTGGDDVGFKSRFGNTPLNSATLQIAPLYRPYSLLLVVLDQSLNLVKNIGSVLVGYGRLRERLKVGSRKYGDSGSEGATR